MDHLPTRHCDADLWLTLLATLLFALLYVTNNLQP